MDHNGRGQQSSDPEHHASPGVVRWGGGHGQGTALQGHAWPGKEIDGKGSRLAGTRYRDTRLY